MVGAFGHHQVDRIAPLEQAEIGAIYDLRLVPAVGVAQLPARSGVRVRSVEARHHHLGPVETSDVALEDLARQVLPLLVLLRQKYLMAARAKLFRKRGVERKLRAREQR